MVKNWFILIVFLFSTNFTLSYAKNDEGEKKLVIPVKENETLAIGCDIEKMGISDEVTILSVNFNKESLGKMFSYTPMRSGKDKLIKDEGRYSFNATGIRADYPNAEHVKVFFIITCLEKKDIGNYSCQMHYEDPNTGDRLYKERVIAEVLWFADLPQGDPEKDKEIPIKEIMITSITFTFCCSFYLVGLKVRCILRDHEAVLDAMDAESELSSELGQLEDNNLEDISNVDGATGSKVSQSVDSEHVGASRKKRQEYAESDVGTAIGTTVTVSSAGTSVDRESNYTATSADE